jgi:hypothetical protein
LPLSDDILEESLKFLALQISQGLATWLEILPATEILHKVDVK